MTGIEMMLKAAGLDPQAIVKQVADVQALVKSVDDRLTSIQNTQATIIQMIAKQQEQAANGKESGSGSGGNASGDTTDNRQLGQSTGPSGGAPPSGGGSS